MIDNLLSWWNLLSPEDRVKVIAGALATILIGILTFFSNSIVITIKRVFTKNEPAPASTAQATQHMSQSQQVIVNIPPQPIIIREEPLPRGEGAGDHAGSPLHTAPIPRTPQYGFVARYDDQGNDLAARVTELLKENRAVALLGSGGVGKTTLAAEIARASSLTPAPLPSPDDPHQERGEGSPKAGEWGEVVWASADGRADFSLTTLLDETATQLGSADLRTLALEQKTNAVRELLGRSTERPYSPLLVLDNFETIAVEQQKAIAAFVNTLSGPALITSRLAVEGADRVGVGAMSPEEARDFLTRLIANSPKRNALMPLIDEIAQTAERNPMVMRWIVGQLELAQRMSDVLDELSHGTGDAATRVFGRSFGLLNADAQAALLSLALCVPSADRAALAFTAGFGDDIKRLNDALKPLAGLQLLETDEKSERLSVVGLTRRFTSAQLDRDSNAAEYRKRFVDYLVRYAEAHTQITPEDLDALEAERENLFAAMDTAFVAEDWRSVMRVMDVVGKMPDGFLYLHGYWGGAIARGEQAAEAARRAGDESAVARFEGNAATIHDSRGKYDKARETYSQVLETYKRLNDEQNVAVFLHQLGNIAYQQGDYEMARARYAESLEIKKKLGNQSGIAITLHQLGMIAQKQGDYETARARYAESLEIKKKLGNQRGIALTYGQMGLLAEKEGNKTEAARLFREALEIFERLKSPNAKIARESLERVEGLQRTIKD